MLKSENLKSIEAIGWEIPYLYEKQYVKRYTLLVSKREKKGTCGLD